MGSDDLFHKRRAKRAEQHCREKARRAPYERILIVCEGEKTEPNYFRWLRDRFRLNRANIVIAHKKGGLDPKSLVEYAIVEYNNDKDFDQVYCVFDKDKHTTFQGALDKIRSILSQRRIKIYAIYSIPCFEFWLLLHFEYTTRPYEAPLNNSNCELVISDLQKYIPGYKKGLQNSLLYIHDNTIDNAIIRSKQVETFHRTSGTDNPSTKVYILVEYLKGLKIYH
ncbi:MAG: RloB family protein [Syntrophorhabdaceae bacterium]|nr:RloB family protein [Syntrophorhabdaceae bacterium]